MPEAEAGSESTPTPEEQLATAQAATAAAEARATEAERRGALVGVLGDKASTPVGQMFLDAYKGEMTAEAIAAGAVEIGLLEAPVEGEEADDGSTEARNDLRNSPGDPGATPLPDPYVTAREIGKAAWQNGTEDDGLAAYFGSVIDSAVRGDKRVLVDYMDPRNNPVGAGR